MDFTGTGPQRADNFNAPPAVTRAAVLYVFRCLVGADIPLNDGCLKPIEIRVPDGTFLSPAPGAAVVAGNTEVSQAVCNALFGALGAVACAQATMNNFLFGDANRQYYETICGGSGAGPGFSGASAIQTHMTNTRMTDPEVLELRYPVRVEEFSIRRGSGGAGRWRGGDGAVRRVRFLAPMTAVIVASRRTVAPFGLAGGADGSARRAMGRARGRLRASTSAAPTAPSSGPATSSPSPRRAAADMVRPPECGPAALVLLLLAVLVLLAVAGAWFVPGTLDWNKYRPEIERLATAALGRPVHIGGAIKLVLLPEPVLTAGDLRIEAAGDGIALAARELRLRTCARTAARRAPARAEHDAARPDPPPALAAAARRAAEPPRLAAERPRRDPGRHAAGRRDLRHRHQRPVRHRSGHWHPLGGRLGNPRRTHLAVHGPARAARPRRCCRP